MDLNDKSILVTGGTGSFGRKFVDAVLHKFRPKRLIVFSRDELKQHEMQSRLPAGGGSPMRYFLGDVRDRDRLTRAFSGVDVVVHAAALKQIPACEYNPFEAIQTNVIGGKNVIDAAIDCGVKRVMAISTDKAVNPVNLYGATKLCAEKLFVQGNAYVGSGETRFSCCRYGNVVGSRGSVIPIFRERAKDGGTITVTDARMTRFWLTLPQGVDFVLRCIEQMGGGEIFVPKLPSMGIMDMAKSIAPKCPVKYTGIRPGEKLHEVLVSEDEARNTVDVGRMYVIRTAHDWWPSEQWKAGKPVADGFRYASDNNTEWLTAQQLNELIEQS